MPTTTYPKDRFDELPADTARVGAHRAENPRLRPGLVLFWSAVAVLVLIAVGVLGTLLISGRLSIFPSGSTSTPAAQAPADAAPVIDTSYPVLILNATAERGLANAIAETVIGAGWSSESVNAGEAGSQDFATTTIYYPSPEDEGAARGLAEVIGGANLEMSDAYPGPVDADGNPGTQLTVVVGADRAGGGGTAG